MAIARSDAVAAITTVWRNTNLEPLASTRMACESAVLQAESDYFSALGRTAQASLADGELVLADAAGTELLRFALSAPTIEPEEPSWS